MLEYSGVSELAGRIASPAADRSVDQQGTHVRAARGDRRSRRGDRSPDRRSSREGSRRWSRSWSCTPCPSKCSCPSKHAPGRRAGAIAAHVRIDQLDVHARRARRADRGRIAARSRPVAGPRAHRPGTQALVRVPCAARRSCRARCTIPLLAGNVASDTRPPRTRYRSNTRHPTQVARPAAHPRSRSCKAAPFGSGTFPCGHRFRRSDLYRIVLVDHDQDTTRRSANLAGGTLVDVTHAGRMIDAGVAANVGVAVPPIDRSLRTSTARLNEPRPAGTHLVDSTTFLVRYPIGQCTRSEPRTKQSVSGTVE